MNKQSTFYFLLLALLFFTSSCQEDLCEKGFFLFCENDNSTPAPGELTEKATGPDGIALVSFSVGNKGYTGTGGVGFPPTGGGNNLFYEYNPLADSWKSIADFPGEGRFDAVGFGTTTKGYVGGGYNIPTGNSGTLDVYFDDFYAYDPQLNQWEKKADLPGGNGIYSGFSTGNRGYVLKEGKFWEYDPAQNIWTPKADCPVASGLTFAIGFRGYVLSNQQLWEYNALTNQWNQKADFPYTSNSAQISFAASNKGYIIGEDQIWEYNPVNNSWFRKVDTPEIREANENGVNLDLEDGFGIDNKGYFGIYYRTFADSFYEFDPNNKSL